jgi:4-hydroxybenzoate polyprenyltransferase
MNKERWIPYIKILRLDHWFKNIFMIPGMVFAYYFSSSSLYEFILPFFAGVLSTCLIASANYVINEYLDSKFDQHHPTKKARPAATGSIHLGPVIAEYAFLITAGLTLAAWIGPLFFDLSAFFILMGVIYNVYPFRTKDRVYLDVISESVNNPIRFILGWAIFETNVFPPSSILLAYWFGGAFLMAIKRYAEYNFIDNPQLAGNYRRSFKFYTKETLLLSSVFYAITSAFFLGIFLIKYRIEFLLSFPVFAGLFTWYLKIGMRPNSIAQYPEKLLFEFKFISFFIFLLAMLAILLYVDIPFLNILLERTKFN